MRRRGRVTQEEIAMDNIRQLQGQIHDMQRDKANLLSENQDLASALVQPLLVHLHLMDHPPQNLTRSDLASARKKTIELQMAMVRRNVSDAKAKPTIAMRDVSVQCSLKSRAKIADTKRPAKKNKASPKTSTDQRGKSNQREAQSTRRTLPHRAKVAKPPARDPWKASGRVATPDVNHIPMSPRVRLGTNAPSPRGNNQAPHSSMNEEPTTERRAMRNRTSQPIYTVNLLKKMRKGDPCSFQIYSP